MKVKVNIINTRYLTMSEAVTVPRLITMTSIVSKESLAMDTHTHIHTYTHRLGVVYLKLFQSRKTKTKSGHQTIFFLNEPQRHMIREGSLLALNSTD